LAIVALVIGAAPEATGVHLAVPADSTTLLLIR
jgi:hypothetical protein